MKIRTIILTAAAALALSAPAAQGAAGADRAAAADATYVPWVTDFGKTPGTAGQTPTVAVASEGVDWADASVGAGIGAALTALLVAAATLVRRPRHGAHGVTA
jgi:hypothetical protein